MLKRFKVGFLVLCIALLLFTGCGDVDAFVPEETEQTTVLSVVTATPTPDPTPTPEPNPYIGLWTLDGRAFGLRLEENGTYLASIDGRERTGTYAFDADGVTLACDAEEPLALAFVDDALCSDDLKLQRSETIPQKQPEPVPVTFEAENDDLRVTVRGAIVEATLKNGKRAQTYCFTNAGIPPIENSRDWFDAGDSGLSATSFRVFKYDGSYTLWVTDDTGAQLAPIDVSVVSGFLYPIRAEGVTPIRIPLETFLSENGSSVDELNAAIASDAAAAGVYTRQGVVTAGVSLISHMAQYGASIVYQGHGSYQKEENWGVNPQWGSKLSRPTSDANGKYKYAGMQCVASIVWAYKAAGLNLCSEYGSDFCTISERAHKEDNKIKYDRAESGDILRIRNHYQMVVDRLDTDGDGADDTYLTYEMWAPHLTFLTLTFRQVQGRKAFSMDAVFEDTGWRREKAKFWEGSFRIPQDAFPAYLYDAVRNESLDREFKELLTALGL